MKLLVEEPEINVRAFAVEDIITTSTGGNDDLGEGGLPVAP